MSALLQLSKALKRSSTLAWVLKYAPDGDRDKALAKAWREEECLRALMHFAWDYHPHSRVRRENTGLPVLLSTCVCAGPSAGAARCRFCADRVRSQFPTPTWAEVEK